MRFSFRLAELLKYSPDPKKRPGVIKAICESTGLDRHHVAALLKNEAKTIPLDALSRLCDYLVAQGHATPEELPGALFAVQAENFWELLARRGSIQLCVGVRRAAEADWPEGAWVVASDAVLLGELLNGVSSLGGTKKLIEGDSANEGKASKKELPRPQPEHFTQSLVWSPGEATATEALERAREVYDEFVSAAEDKALICLGSMKSNPVGELTMASAFGCEPFHSQDDRASASLRDCPFFIRFRDTDPHPESCWGGVQLSASEPAAHPGIYYELPDGKWAGCRSDGVTQEVAFMFYVHCEAQGWLEMTLGGFSGRATRLLAHMLVSRAEQFWPPVYSGFGHDYGAFVVRFPLEQQGERWLDPLRPDTHVPHEVIALHENVIRRRVESRHAG